MAMAGGELSFAARLAAAFLDHYTVQNNSIGVIPRSHRASETSPVAAPIFASTDRVVPPDRSGA